MGNAYQLPKSPDERNDKMRLSGKPSPDNANEWPDVNCPVFYCS